MAKKVIAEVKLQIPAGQANPSPPVGPALGQRGVNIMEFCKAFNARTQAQPGMIIPVIITVYADRSFTFVTKTPPASVLLKKAAGVVGDDPDARFAERSLTVRRQPVPDHPDHCGVHLDVFDGSGPVLQHLAHRSFDSAAQDEDARRLGMLKGRQVGEVLRFGPLGLE